MSVETPEIEVLVNELDTRVDRLRSLYEQYFMGIEKMVPAVAHKDVERRIQILRKEQIRNTALRFRFQMVIQRYGTYQSHWQRTCRQIEEGTYKRDLLRARARFAPKKVVEGLVDEGVDVTFSSSPPAPEKVPEALMPRVIPDDRVSEKLVLDPDENIGELDLLMREGPESVREAQKATPMKPLTARPPPTKTRPVWRKVGAEPPAAETKQAPKPPPLPPKAAPKAPPAMPQKPAPVAATPAATPKPAPKPGDLSDTRLRQIYSEYVQTRRTHNESTAAITYDAMAKSLRESSEKLRAKHGKAIDFEVTVKEGKTILKPVVKPK